MSRRLEACYFAIAGSDGRWDRLARVLDWTARAQLPGWQVTVNRLAAAPMPNHLGSRTYASNTEKLDHWATVVEASHDGDELLLIDADTMIVRPLDDIWARDFDVAYTTKTKGKFPLNGGVIFLRVSSKVKAFMRAWATENRRLFETSPRIAPWMFSHGGVNQASLAAVLATAPDLTVLELPCTEWNCEDTSWATFDPAVTRIVHVKGGPVAGGLRAACLSQFAPDPTLAELRALWLGFERDARAVLFGAR